MTPFAPKRSRSFFTDAQFADFWQLYPRPKNRIQAQDAMHWAFQTANEDGTLFEKIMAALAWQIREQPVAQYWPEPHRWLFGKRWEDQPLKAAPTAALDEAQRQADREWHARRNDMPDLAAERERKARSAGGGA